LSWSRSFPYIYVGSEISDSNVEKKFVRSSGSKPVLALLSRDREEAEEFTGRRSERSHNDRL